MSIYKSLHTLSLHDALASSKRFAREGFLVKVGRRGGDKLQPLVDEIEAAGGRVAARGLDARIPDDVTAFLAEAEARSEEHTSELPSLMRISYAVFSLKKKIHPS